MPCATSGCAISCIAIMVGWLLVTSGLLFLTWNKVMVPQFKMKKGSFFQALLIVVTLAAFCLPSKMNRRGKYWGKSCGDHSQCGKFCPLKNRGLQAPKGK